ncbi:hypothetical protein CG724_03775 [Streptomyces sp. CB02120-2]|nr:hypothetical protein CG724_03775 [Streptomyces sp. CB02120-2]
MGRDLGLFFARREAMRRARPVAAAAPMTAPVTASPAGPPTATAPAATAPRAFALATASGTPGNGAKASAPFGASGVGAGVVCGTTSTMVSVMLYEPPSGDEGHGLML